jgi:endonuclease YncB( thermonuclease family)
LTAVATVALAPAAGAAPDPVAQAAAVCADYPNQAAAQDAADTVDADGDGRYCESLPCPCAAAGDADSGGGGGSSEPPPRPPPASRAQRIEARITSVVDGDTVRVRAFEAQRAFYTVRLIRIDTPETRAPGRPVECGGKRATANMLRLAFTRPRDTNADGLLDDEGGTGRGVTLVTDPSQDLFDRYGRLLAYVTARNGALLQTRQLADGWAKTYVFERPFRQLRRFQVAERRARAGRRGVWSLCGGNFHRPTS